MRIGFLADIHEDILHLRIALDVLERQRCEQIVCLGDIVGFTLPFYQYIQTRDAESCVSLVRERCSVAVAGNHDLYAARKIPEHQAGFDYGENWYGIDYATRAKRARSKIWLYEDNEIPPQLSFSSIDYLRTLPEFALFSLGASSGMATHFCYPDLSGSTIYYPEQSFHLKKHFQFLEAHGCRLGISGHGHPEGCLLVDEDHFTLHPFGRVQLTGDPVWIVAPCIARTSRANGCLVLDTATMTLDIIPLKDQRREHPDRV